MKKYRGKFYLSIISCLLLTISAFAGGQPEKPVASNTDKFETRCGWFDNPTPSNMSLYDRDGEWAIGIQGGYQVKTDWDWPVFASGQWVQTNGDYGYGCVCMQMKANGQNHEVLAIKSTRAQSLSVCRQDPSLKQWKHLFK